MKKVKKENEDKYPGYPYYDQEEDIYKNDEELETDPESLNRDIPETVNNKKKTPVNEPIMEWPVPDDILEEYEEETESLNENDISKDDLIALGSLDEDNDGGEDELLKKDRIYPIEMTGGDLDIPGAEEDDQNELNGEEDEESNLYSAPD